ncbi:hypothetical protein M0Q97_05660 [Candidatus Dojkabacteria bacterium]|jgi:hypothetical protein|nr:hypothetical protein [Candidatus Dojkabacteria bacterium]
MKYIKTFEESEQKHYVIIDDIVKHNNHSEIVAYNFITDLMNNKNIIAFNCKNCTTEINGSNTFINSHKTHKGIINGFGYGYNEYSNQVNIEIVLKRIKYNHNMDTSLPMCIFGELSKENLKLIKDTNTIIKAKKYNL